MFARTRPIFPLACKKHTYSRGSSGGGGEIEASAKAAENIPSIAGMRETERKRERKKTRAPLADGSGIPCGASPNALARAQTELFMSLNASQDSRSVSH